MSQQRILIDPAQMEADGRLVLTRSQHHYLSRVLRLGEGDRFWVLDGRGGQWLAAMTGEAAIATLLEQHRGQDFSAVGHLVLAAALPKGSGFDEVVRQVTELGVAQIQPILSERTLLYPSPNKLERWRRIAAEAAEQSERLTVPEVLSPIPWLDFLPTDRSESRYLCVARGGVPHLQQRLMAQPAASVTVAIGPEGGWTDAEIRAAGEQGFQPVSLGSMILRAVTAPIVALSLVRAQLEAGLPAAVSA